MRTRQILTAFLAISLLIFMASPCHAAEEGANVYEGLEENGIAEIEETGAAEEPAYEEEMDSYDSYITETVKDEINTAQLTFHCIMPDGFNLGVYAEIRNTNIGKSYQLLATSVNEYISRMYVPEGFYEIENIYVAGDTKNQYPMDIPESFLLYGDDMYTLETTLLNYDEIKKEADIRLGVAEDTAAVPAETLLETQKKPVSPWRSVEHTGDGGGQISISGTCVIPVHMILEITASGEIGEAEYKYSTDGGNTWSDVGLVRRSATAIPILTTDTGEESGLNLSFDGYGQYLMMDEYRFNSAYEYAITNASGNSGNGEIHLTSEEIIYETDYKIVVKIVSTGGLGQGIFKYSLNGGLTFSGDEVIPDDGVYQIPGTLLYLTFWHPDADGRFPVGNMYEAEIRGDKSNRNYVPYIFGLMIAVFFGVFILYSHYAKMKDKPGDYVLNPYKRVDVRSRKGRR